MSAKDELWARGADMMEALGVRSKAKSLIGKWLKTASNDHALVLNTILRAAQERPIEPVAWITKALQEKVKRLHEDDRRSVRGACERIREFARSAEESARVVSFTDYLHGRGIAWPVAKRES